VHGAVWFSLARIIIVEAISFFIIIFRLVTILHVVVGIIRVSSRGNWCGIRRSGRCDRGSWWRSRGDPNSPSE
jgi:hypothetical protein